jgi:hypothetical protein
MKKATQKEKKRGTVRIETHKARHEKDVKMCG